MVIQLILSVFVAIVLIKTIVDLTKKKLRLRKFLLWWVFWIAVLVVFWWPDTTQKIAELLQVGRGADAVFYISIVVIFYTIFKLYSRLDKIDKNQTTLAREIALMRGKQESDKN